MGKDKDVSVLFPSVTSFPKTNPTSTCSTPGRYGGRIDLGTITQHNLQQLKRLNQVVFPVAYNEKFYIDVLHVGDLAKLAYFNDIAVGAVCCRIDTSNNQRRLYIMTLGCLAAYRNMGIGKVMVDHVLSLCETDGKMDGVYLHVQISNDSAIEFYRRFGFEIIDVRENYYKRIEPPDAYVLQKTLRGTPPKPLSWPNRVDNGVDVDRGGGVENGIEGGREGGVENGNADNVAEAPVTPVENGLDKSNISEPTLTDNCVESTD